MIVFDKENQTNYYHTSLKRVPVSNSLNALCTNEYQRDLALSRLPNQ